MSLLDIIEMYLIGALGMILYSHHTTHIIMKLLCLDVLEYSPYSLEHNKLISSVRRCSVALHKGHTNAVIKIEIVQSAAPFQCSIIPRMRIRILRLNA